MKTVGLSVVGAALFGLLAYGAIRLLWPEIGVGHFGNVIGVAAVAGAGLGVWWARRAAASGQAPGRESGRESGHG